MMKELNGNPGLITVGLDAIIGSMNPLRCREEMPGRMVRHVWGTVAQWKPWPDKVHA